MPNPFPTRRLTPRLASWSGWSSPLRSAGSAWSGCSPPTRSATRQGSSSLSPAITASPSRRPAHSGRRPMAKQKPSSRPSNGSGRTAAPTRPTWSASKPSRASSWTTTLLVPTLPSATNLRPPACKQRSWELQLARGLGAGVARLPLFDEREALLLRVVRGPAADGEGGTLVAHLVVEGVVQAALHNPLRHDRGDRRMSGDLRSRLLRRGKQLSMRHEPLEQPHAQRFLGANRPAGQDHVECVA